MAGVLLARTAPAVTPARASTVAQNASVFIAPLQRAQVVLAKLNQQSARTEARAPP